jgi:hypothetical protein
VLKPVVNTPTAVDSANSVFQKHYGTEPSFKPSSLGIQGHFTAETSEHMTSNQFRNDLLECQIYLCSPYVLHMFKDNFDYLTMTEFVRGVLIDEEVAGNTVYIDIIQHDFNFHFSIIHDLNTYFFETMRLLTNTDLVLGIQEKSNYK